MNDFSTVVNREFTLLLPGVAHLVPVKTKEQILNKCLQADFRAESVDWLLNYSKNNSCGILYCTGM